LETIRARDVRDVEHFNEAKGTVACDHCGKFELSVREKGAHIELVCDSCGRWLKYLAQHKTLKTKRPKSGLKPAEVWAEFSDHCSFCGLSGGEIDYLGLEKQIQHVPPYSETGHEYALPICSWCQQTSATNMKRLQSLIERLNKKFTMK
jgi:transcription elongation factor Elf1